MTKRHLQTLNAANAEWSPGGSVEARCSNRCICNRGDSRLLHYIFQPFNEWFDLIVICPRCKGTGREPRTA